MVVQNERINPHAAENDGIAEAHVDEAGSLWLLSQGV